MLKRTHNCGQLRSEHVGQSVVLCGWVHARRDHGGMIFVDLRDREGITQLVFDSQKHPDAYEHARGLRSEYVVAAAGTVVRRQSGKENPKLPTGEIELEVHQLEILNVCETPPFEIGAVEPISEELRLRYRYLDLRRPSRQNIFIKNQIPRKYKSIVFFCTICYFNFP